MIDQFLVGERLDQKTLQGLMEMVLEKETSRAAYNQLGYLALV